MSPFRKGVKRNGKTALLGLVTVCLTVLCFSLLMQERLCSFSISSGSTLVQATLSCDN
ncbi:type I toxin-antitoxin system Hok family toxin [Providencia rettgeri]|nr:type I toxin-antitoxin system Hok family toxin [Providencia rettgeri]